MRHSASMSWLLAIGSDIRVIDVPWQYCEYAHCVHAAAK